MPQRLIVDDESNLVSPAGTIMDTIPEGAPKVEIANLPQILNKKQPATSSGAAAMQTVVWIGTKLGPNQRPVFAHVKGIRLFEPGVVAKQAFMVVDCALLLIGVSSC